MPGTSGDNPYASPTQTLSTADTESARRRPRKTDLHFPVSRTKFSFAALLPACTTITQINEHRAPGSDLNSHFSTANIAGIVVFLILAVLALPGLAVG